MPSELVVGIPHFQPPLFMHLDFAFSPLSVTYDEEALKSLINFFVPPRRERAVSTALVLLLATIKRHMTAALIRQVFRA